MSKAPHGQSDQANLAKTGHSSNAPAAGEASAKTSTENATVGETAGAAKAHAETEAAKPHATQARTTAADPLLNAKTAEEEEKILAERTERENARALGKEPAEGQEFKAPDGSVLRAGEVRVQGDPLKSPDAMMEQHARVDRENDERNKRNEENWNALMRKEEEERLRAQEVAKETPPPTGKQRDVNTPDIIHPDGSMSFNSGA